MKLYVVLCFFFLFGLSSCEDDTNLTKLQMMPDMVDCPTSKTGRSIINPPEFSVAYNAMIYPKTLEEAEKLLMNPFENSSFMDEHVKKGKKLYGKFCSHCHGDGALGDGPVTKKFPRPPSLLSDDYVKRADGFYFYRITFGSELMPSQGHALDPSERWQIVMYLRDLQEAEK